MSCLHRSVLWLWLCATTAAEPLKSGVRRAHKDDIRHLYVARPRGSETWSPELAHDFVLLDYDRANGDVLGYQRSSGKVFAQHSPSNPRMLTESLSLSDAVLIGIRSGSAGLQTLEHQTCQVMAADPGSGLPDWRPVVRSYEAGVAASGLGMLSVDLPWYLTWRAESQSVTGTRNVVLSSNGDFGLSCECRWVQTSGLWRAVRGASQSLRCEPNRKPHHDEEHTGPESELSHESQGPAALRPLLRYRAARFCREMQAKFFNRILLVLPTSSLVRSDGTALDCWALATKHFGRKHVTDSIGYAPQRLRLPRSQILTDIKFGMQTLSVVQSLVAAISLDVETEASTSAYAVARNLRFALRLYQFAGRNQDSTTVNTDLNKALWHLAQTVNQSRFEQNPLPLAVPRVCDPDIALIPGYELLAQLLHSSTASFTPESANTTLVSQAFASFTVRSIQCLGPAMDAYETFSRCSAGDDFGTHIRDSNAFSKSIKQMNNLALQRYTGASDQMPMDLADQAVEKALEVLEELIYKAQQLSELYVLGVKAHQKRVEMIPNLVLRPQQNESSQTQLVEWIRFTAQSHAWCCATHPTHSILDLQPKGCMNEIERHLWRFY